MEKHVKPFSDDCIRACESSCKDSTYGLVEKVVLPQEKEKLILYPLL